MSISKRIPGKNQADQPTGPRVTRPLSPGRAYGIPTDEKGLLPWSHVSERMTQGHAYWICTVSPEGQPHATPVDGLWLDDRLYFGGSTETRRNRNLETNPAVCVHLESGSDVVILHGEAHVFRAPEPALAIRLSEASAKKYGYGPKPEDYQTAAGMYVFEPRVVFAWKQFPRDVTRWVLSSEGGSRA